MASRTLKILFLFYLCFLPLESFSCSSILSSFSFECGLQNRYLKLKSSFKKNWNINIEDIYYYKAIRLIEEKDLKNAFLNNKMPREIYTPAPDTWDFWEKGLDFIENAPDEISLDFLKSLHRHTINEKLIGPLSYSLSFLIPLEKTFLLGAGNIRESNYHFRPFFSFSCEEKISEDFIRKITKNDLVGKDKKSLIEFTYSSCEGGKFVSGTLFYTESIRVKEEIEYLLEKLNYHLNSLKKIKYKKTKRKNPLSQSPLYVMSQLQRHYVAIHPFREGNGRLSRFIQDIFSRRLDFPFIPAGLLQNDVLRDKWSYFYETREALNILMSKLDSCFGEYNKYKGQQKKISLYCQNIKELMK